MGPELDLDWLDFTAVAEELLTGAEPDEETLAVAEEPVEEEVKLLFGQHMVGIHGGDEDEFLCGFRHGYYDARYNPSRRLNKFALARVDPSYAEGYVQGGKARRKEMRANGDLPKLSYGVRLLMQEAMAVDPARNLGWHRSSPRRG